MSFSTSDKTIGAVLVASSVAVVATISNHPTSAHSGAVGPLVHSAMIIWLTLWTWGYFHVSLRLGMQRPLVTLGLLTSAISLAGHIGAASINGFVVPALAAPGAPAVDHNFFRFAWYSNQTLTQLAVYMTAVALVSWSIELLAGRWPARLLAYSGLAAGTLSAVLLAGGAIRMNVTGAILIYSLQAAWTALLGIELFRGQLGRVEEDRAVLG